MKARKRLTREESKGLTRMRLIEAGSHRRPKALDGIFQQVSEPAEWIAAVREWLSNRWRLKDFVALRIEFTRRAIRDRCVWKHLAVLSIGMSVRTLDNTTSLAANGIR